MSRAHIYKVFQNGDGSVLTGATVRVIEEDTTDLITDTLWTTDTGSSTLDNPFVSDDGKVEFYLDNPKRLRLGVTPNGGAEFFVITDANPNAGLVVVAAVPNLSLGTPVHGFIPKVNSSGQFEYINPASLGGGGGGSTTITTNDALADAYDLGPTYDGSVIFDNTGYSVESGESNPADGFTAWFTWLCPEDGTYLFDTAATPLPIWDSVVDIYTADDPTAPTFATLTQVATDDDGDLQPGEATGAGTSRATLVATKGTVYFIQVDAFDDSGDGTTSPAGAERDDAVLRWMPKASSYTPPAGLLDYVGSYLQTADSTFPVGSVVDNTSGKYWVRLH